MNEFLDAQSYNYDGMLEVIEDLSNSIEEDEIRSFDMTSLGTLMLLGHSTAKSFKDSNSPDVDNELHRLSLAYEKLQDMPKLLIQELGSHVKILDISYNEFENLDFASEFKELTHLICDHNNITSKTVIPFMPRLELLWMNNCKISELYPWARKLQYACPNLKYLSLMGNTVAPSYLNGGSFYEYLNYRLFIISLFPNLKHLDDKAVTPNQVKEAQKLYHRPLVERLISRSHQNLPAYLRVFSERVSNMLAPTPSYLHSETNAII